MFMMGKIFKYTCWTLSSYFLYHVYLVFKKDKPEEGLACHSKMLHYAY